MSRRNLTRHRSAILTTTGFVAFDAGVWTVTANLWGAGIGAGIGLAVLGALFVILEWLTTPGPR
jgi:hypothetical protein